MVAFLYLQGREREINMRRDLNNKYVSTIIYQAITKKKKAGLQFNVMNKTKLMLRQWLNSRDTMNLKLPYLV